MTDVEVQLPYGPPPVLPDVEKQLEEYLLCPDRLPIHDYENSQQFWPREPDPCSLYHYEISPVGTTLKVDRDHTTGKVLQFREVPVDDIGCTAKNSMSLRRAPCPSRDAIQGTDINCLFWPGGFPKPPDLGVNEDQNVDVNFEDDLLYIAPGLGRGIQFKSDGYTPIGKDEPAREIEEVPSAEGSPEKEASPGPSLMDILHQEEDLLGLWKDTSVENRHKDAAKTVIQTMKVDSEEDDLKVVPEKDTVPVLKISRALPLKKSTKYEWAEEIDISTFPADKIPTYPEKFTCNYELDPFQKHAILLLEKQSHVFVAAPTSAGKTIVAEYAIALSMERKSKTVYTAPIKALSNQKFHEFKYKWGKDVGLITGDVQINQKAGCLIMTTEILRHMLYHGSNVIQDLEFVIFDEVHYINNVERGYVWEEVLILLPASVVIVMLSATVPNTLEFANWVGRIKQKKMSVITIVKRPVPLEYYLYPATVKKGIKLKDPIVRIMDSKNNFNQKGYQEVKEAMPEDTYNTYLQMKPKEEKNMWIKFIRELEKKKLLPVVSFTLSRNRCDQYSSFLESIDLTSSEEKIKIRHLLEKYLKRLKDHDEDLPQIQNMKNMLKRGIGVHHSGILPILKEIVEHCFASKYVKLLFATETFAMGVNMPARTVLFDSIRKFDGQASRTLEPAEFIQMAGRAGRRNEESVGTVIILCKKKVPNLNDLKIMMMGTPQMLTSQFRLTYSMILRLLRVDNVTVEYMMARSFMEYHEQSKHGMYKKKVEDIESKIAKLGTISNLGGFETQFSKLYDTATEYLELLRSTKPDSRVKKDFLEPGRVLLICHKSHVNKLALLLKVETHREEMDLTVLVLCNDESLDFSNSNEINLEVKLDSKKPIKERSDEWYKVMSLINQNKLFVPDASGGHTILKIPFADIIDITNKTLKVKSEIVINDWSERQMPRFRDRLPGETFRQVLQDLNQLSFTHADGQGLWFVKWQRNLDPSKKGRLEALRNEIRAMKVTEVVNFEEMFVSLFERKELERQSQQLKFKQSYESMMLYGDYQNKVEVLRKLGYIDKTNAVDVKGQVAIRIRKHELLITELVLGNILTNMPAEEIAALLSCMVFEQKKANESLDINASLKKGVEKIENVNKMIRKTEKECGVQPGVDSIELNFNLVEVVYKWATGEHFADIMKFTDVQEGIIVRCIQQLNDILSDVKSAATIVGDTMLGEKMDEASSHIKREIVFAASLYTTDDYDMKST